MVCTAVRRTCQEPFFVPPSHIWVGRSAFWRFAGARGRPSRCTEPRCRQGEYRVRSRGGVRLGNRIPAACCHSRAQLDLGASQRAEAESDRDGMKLMGRGGRGNRGRGWTLVEESSLARGLDIFNEFTDRSQGGENDRRSDIIGEDEKTWKFSGPLNHHGLLEIWMEFLHTLPPSVPSGVPVPSLDTCACSFSRTST